MSFTVSAEILEATTSDYFAKQRRRISDRDDREIFIDISSLDRAVFEDVLQAAKKAGDTKVVRALDSVSQAWNGVFDKSVPSFKAFMPMLISYLKHNLLDGWLYKMDCDGQFYPMLVTGVNFDEGRLGRGDTEPKVIIKTVSYGFMKSGGRQEFGTYTGEFCFFAGDVVRRKVADILMEKSLYKETPELRAAFQASVDRCHELIRFAFAKQFRFSGRPLASVSDPYGRSFSNFSNAKVINDLSPERYAPTKRSAESTIVGQEGVSEIPEHPIVRIFDLADHQFYWVHSDFLTPYNYNKSLRDKLILPKSHTSLLDILTTDITAFVDDIIEGKSAGNIILAKGRPGVGKTLTAEVYSELVERPLYSIHTGTLGTTAEEIEKNLKVVFSRAQNWDCVLLLDEADVFVAERGDNIEQNAIVAEFLRTMEYFPGLMFMTTNRVNDIDQAILPRCAAVIEYELPSQEDAAKIWMVMSDQFKANLSPDLVQDLIRVFKDISPRDIKMLLRMALRVSEGQGRSLDMSVFRECAMFRAIKIHLD